MIGIPDTVVAAYALSTFVLAAFTHGNIRWPSVVERFLQPILNTLEMHRIHHSIMQEESNTNFGVVLSIWDRIFGTLRLPQTNQDSIIFGVRELSRHNTCKPLGMLLTPWRVRT
jgi:sterol desaturase/sphingolipid hydroxylase (fatty acid hydroxylase superfamily)